jgi:hypothetical protein
MLSFREVVYYWVRMRLIELHFVIYPNPCERPKVGNLEVLYRVSK